MHKIREGHTCTCRPIVDDYNIHKYSRYLALFRNESRSKASELVKNSGHIVHTVRIRREMVEMLSEYITFG